MKNQMHVAFVIASASMIALACQRDQTIVGPSLRGSPRATREATLDGPKAVVVNPNANGNGVATTIQEAIDRVASGGQVLVKAGTYTEALIITKGLTLRPIGEGEGQVIIAPPGAPNIAIQVSTPEPVVIQDVTLHVRLDDVTVERVTGKAVNSAVLSTQQRVMAFFNDGLTSHGRAHVTLRDNLLDGGVGVSASTQPPFPQMFGISVQGDVTGSIERNTLRRMGGACITVTTRPDLGGETNVDIVDNDLDECYPLQRAGSLLVQPLAGVRGTVTATGVVNIIGNTIRNTLRSPLPATAISQFYAPGRIERNQILGVVQPEATGILGNRNPAAIWIGSLSTTAIAPDIAPVVRFNDIEGNAYAGLRVGPNIRTSITATCNWWGTVDGPSVLTTTNPQVRDAIVIESGAATPSYRPFATTPIALTSEKQCD